MISYFTAHELIGKGSIDLNKLLSQFNNGARTFHFGIPSGYELYLKKYNMNTD